MLALSRRFPAAVIIIFVMANSGVFSQDRSLSGKEVMKILADTQVAKFEIKEQRPDIALKQLLHHVEAEAPGIAKRIRIQSKHPVENLGERLERYPNIHLAVANENAAEIFRAIVELARWHFEVNNDGILISDWHRGDLIK